MCHTEIDDNGNEKIKTLGKLLDQNVVLESKATIVLKTGVQDGRYYFSTQNNGKDTVKSPMGMFQSQEIDNDLNFVDKCIRAYYGMEDAVSDDEIAAEAAEHAVEIHRPEEKRTRQKAKEEKDAAIKQETTVPEGTDEEVPFTEDSDAGKTSAPAKTEDPAAAAPTRRSRKPRAIEPEGQPENPDEAANNDVQVLTEDTYYHDLANDNYICRHAGETVVLSEGGKTLLEQITHDQFVAGCKAVAQEAPAEQPHMPERRRRRRA